MRSLCPGFVLVAALGCGHESDRARPGDRTTNMQPAPSITAFVAASTQDAFKEIAEAFAKKTKVEIKLNADDTSKLAEQIAHDAPAHIFLSAHQKWVDFINEKDFVGKELPLLGNSLVIVVPKGNVFKISRPGDLLLPGVKRLAIAGPTVPAGIYARQALKKLGLWNDLEAEGRLVSGDNVRFTLTYVERGDVDAGIVYASDAQITDAVEAVYTFQPDTHEPIRYPLVLLKGAEEDDPVVRPFFDFLQSVNAGMIFEKYGFTFLPGK